MKHVLLDPGMPDSIKLALVDALLIPRKDLVMVVGQQAADVELFFVAPAKDTVVLSAYYNGGPPISLTMAMPPDVVNAAAFIKKLVRRLEEATKK